MDVDDPQLEADGRDAVRVRTARDARDAAREELHDAARDAVGVDGPRDDVRASYRAVIERDGQHYHREVHGQREQRKGRSQARSVAILAQAVLAQDIR